MSAAGRAQRFRSGDGTHEWIEVWDAEESRLVAVERPQERGHA